MPYSFPDAFSAYWIRYRSDSGCTSTATQVYQ